VSPVSILGLASIVPLEGQPRVTQIGDEADKASRRLPRVDRMAVQAARVALGSHSVEGLGLVVGTGYGGLQATVDFLEGLATRGAAFGSPTAFHQSVHHSPAGQISLALKIRGPSLTCSAREISSEAALLEGIDLLRLGRCERVLVVSSDEVVAPLEAAFKAFDAPWVPSEGAGAVLLGGSGGELEISSVEMKSEPLSMLQWKEPPQAGAAVNPSGGMIRLVEAARALSSGQNIRLQSHALGGGSATVELRRK
jgi:hypothetical protein